MSSILVHYITRDALGAQTSLTCARQMDLHGIPSFSMEVHDNFPQLDPLSSLSELTSVCGEV